MLLHQTRILRITPNNLRAKLKKQLRDCIALDIQAPTTHYYAEITLELKRQGKPIPTNDIWIAALCRQHSLPLLSRDSHFDLIAGTRQIGW